MNQRARRTSKAAGTAKGAGRGAREGGPPAGPRPPEFYKTFHRINEGITNAVDPLGQSAPIVHAQLAWLAHPQELAERAMRLSSDLWRLQWHTWNRALGLPSADPVTPHQDDTRFADPVWTESPTWDLVKEWYLAFTHHTQDMIYDTPALSGKERRRAAFWWRNWLNAMAPTNFLLTNPVALRKAVESGGASLARGHENFLADLKAGNVRMTDPDDFKVGENLATTEGAVVFRNRLLEVIHYAPRQPRVHAEPVVIITPWINKFYVLDLTPKRSLVRFLLDQGLDVFITSWKNPDATMRDVTFDDYLLEGVDTIARVAREFTDARQVHAVGYCIGGTALAMYMAWAVRRYGEEAMPVSDWTLFTTLVDFHKPGDIEVFIDRSSIDYLCDKMAAKGYLDGADMAASFRLLRSNSLIWQYVVNGWLYGETPPPFDVLYWNMDSTRMPYAMHAWYLRELYLENRLIQPNALRVAGETLDLSLIRQPLYVVAAEDDHIAPWRQTFAINNHVTGNRRYVLSSSGHILGILNPIVHPPKRRYWVADAYRSDTTDTWRQRAEEHEGSWWEDWMRWLKPRVGPEVEARAAASERFPALCPAPGSYVLET
ncbi:PHA/PHB synthase family protein [Thauera linaloolentis]|uniref:Poly-beta-hydroxybutyrate polymerase domain-containing protein n=1 Tax=Thauera linaloolentis (strain DSM 12138 / JCM 21573 / CCUG 41526 / CIP 105981 / IAM 15112 / NBRC 102519 / 47Lol) TaxID=1123367 RepID=N6Y3T3_THAL4|nr:poly-beta-hydroxybutyrate polymerase domain-containing protein [Thauera linaloolentis]ENO86250.1 poly-beta-hydroxybutyrate polymerase domain-containing protein [Thauera linaloolentis 47Lol = DSM 12138]MCM8566944.1 alpha/beta hydrolase [Thauera linaloolentis]